MKNSRRLVATGLGLLVAALAACGEDRGQVPGEAEAIRTLQRELDAAASADAATFTRVRPVRPVLGCVERLAGDQVRAHFGYVNSAAAAISIPVGFFNRFVPPPVDRGQPTGFAPGAADDVVQVTFSKFGASIWVLGNHFAVATRFSRPCPGGGAGGIGVGGIGVGGSGVGGSSGAGGSGGCPSSCDDHDPCTIDGCNDSTGFTCLHIPALDGTVCDDRDPCTRLDTCRAGVCIGGVPAVCRSPDDCHLPAGACNPVSGACEFVALPDGTPCGDTDPCTTPLACRFGLCSLYPVVRPPGCGDVQQQCGTTLCPPGQVCCNASCGICTPPGGACVQVICEPPPVERNVCRTDADCRAFSDYCTGCDCRALSTCQRDPVCPGPGVQCLIDPCQLQQVFCDAGQCALRPRAAVQCDVAACGPALGLPNTQCPDGKTVAGPTGRCLPNPDGSCGWEVISCPTPGICLGSG